MSVFCLANSSIQGLSPHSGLGFALLLAGALMTAAVGVSVFSFYIDEYWADQELRETLRRGPSKKRKLS